MSVLAVGRAAGSGLRPWRLAWSRPRRRAALLALLASLPLVSSCALDVGAPITTLVEGRLDVALTPPAARDLGAHTVLNSRGERAQFTLFELDIVDVRLASTQGGATGFDPAEPPPGYSLCHSGHCHADDGRLVPYADIQRELAGGEVGFVPVVTLPVDATLDLLAPAPFSLTQFSPGADLRRGTLARAIIQVSGLRMRVRIEGARAAEWVVDLPLGLTLGAELNIDVDDTLPPTLSPRVALVVDGLFLDAVDVFALSTTSTIVSDHADAPGVAALTEALATLRPSLEFIEPQETP